MSSENILIIVPGLGGENPYLKKVANSWSKYGIKTYIHNVNWRDGEKSFKPKLKRLVNQIDELSKKGRISLLGTSAGGSAVLNAFNERKSKIHKVVNVCGRLRKGVNVFPSLNLATITSPSFKESVLVCEKIQKQLTKKDKAKIQTIQSLFDQTVPISTMTIEGANNEQIFSIGHGLSISLAMTVYSKNIIRFLKD